MSKYSINSENNRSMTITAIQQKYKKKTELNLVIVIVLLSDCVMRYILFNFILVQVGEAMDMSPAPDISIRYTWSGCRRMSVNRTWAQNLYRTR